MVLGTLPNSNGMNPLLQIAIDAAKEAGEEILKLYATTDFETKQDGSPLTIADSHSNEILLKHLIPTGLPILSEEIEGISLGHKSGTPYPSPMWIIDPLDGTKDFLKKTDDFSVMIGLLEHGRPVLGVVYAPVTDTLVYAEKGAGAYMVQQGETTRLSVSTRTTEDLRFVCSVNHFTPDMEYVASTLKAQKTPRGSIGIKAGVLGEGKGEFFYSVGNFGEWDVCAPEIITEEAGGVVTDCEGNILFYGTPDHRVAHGILFSNGACHEYVLDGIQRSRVMGIQQ